MEAGLIQSLDLHDVDAGENRVIHLQYATVLRLFIQKIAVGADVDRCIRHDLLTERVNGRIRNLCEQLLEVIEQQLMLARENRQRHIVSHRSRRLHAVFRHGQNSAADILVGIAEYLVQLIPQELIVGRNLLVGNRKLREMQQIPVQPFAVGLMSRVAALTFLIGNDLLLLGIHQKNPPRLES